VVKDQVVPHSTVMLVAQVRLGAKVSTTVTTWLHREVFRQESNASQFRVTVKLVGQLTVRLVTSGPTTRKVGLVSQMSETLGVVKDQLVPHSTVRFVPQVRLGARVSMTVTVWLQKLLPAQPPRTLQVRVAWRTVGQEMLLFVVVVSTVMVTVAPLPL